MPKTIWSADFSRLTGAFAPNLFSFEQLALKIGGELEIDGDAQELRIVLTEPQPAPQADLSNIPAVSWGN